MSLTLEKIMRFKREFRQQEYAAKKREFMRASCWISPRLTFGDNRFAMQLYTAPRPFEADGVVHISAKEAVSL